MGPADALQYDLVAGRRRRSSSAAFLPRKAVVHSEPQLDPKGMVGAIRFSDGQHDDARVNLLAIGTALHHKAVACLNYTSMERIREAPVKNDRGVFRVVDVRDHVSGEAFAVHARCIVNATGAYTDGVRAQYAGSDEPRSIVEPSSGVHVVLPLSAAPAGFGLFHPRTSDGRVLFVVPWEGRIVAGTTDHPADVSYTMKARAADVDFILREVSTMLAPGARVGRADVLSSWSGLRPLVRDPSKGNTESLSRTHVVHVNKGRGVVTVAGGKWTTFRRMAEDAVDAAVGAGLVDLADAAKGKPGQHWRDVRLLGSQSYDAVRAPNEFAREFPRLPEDVRAHLLSTYGDQAPFVAQMCQDRGLDGRLSPAFPYLEGEVAWAAEWEFAETANDVLCRRTRLAFLDARAASESVERVVEIMAAAKGWDKARQADEVVAAREHVSEFDVSTWA